MTETMEIANATPVNLWTETCGRCGHVDEIGLGIWMDSAANPVCAEGCVADRWGANAQGE